MNEFSRNYFFQIRKKEIKNFFPGYFSLVMATGIVSIACFLLGFIHISKLLLYFNVAFYVILWVFFIQHIVRFFSEFSDTLGNHAKSPGYLAVVAGTNVLGSQFVIIENNIPIAGVLCVLGFILWVILLYSIIYLLTIKKKKPTLEKGINGIWLLIVVSTQSVAILGMQVADFFPTISDMIIFNSVGFYMMGCMFYIILITLIFYRLTFLKLDAKELAPSYWINMGAVSITTLAGTTILLSPSEFPEYLNQIAPFINGFTLLFWAIGTWWIPIIVILGVWKHVYQKIPLLYQHQYWSLVFPLGMYTACSIKLFEALSIDFMQPIFYMFLYIALFSWIVAFLGLIINIIRNIKLASSLNNKIG